MCEDKREKNTDTYWRKNTTVIFAACPVGRCPFRWSSGWPSSTWIYIRLFVHRYHMNRQENSTKRWHCEGTLDVSGKPVHVRIIVLSYHFTFSSPSQPLTCMRHPVSMSYTLACVPMAAANNFTPPEAAPVTSLAKALLKLGTKHRIKRARFTAR